MQALLDSIIQDDTKILNGIDEENLNRFAELIVNKKRLFVCGTGRSLLMNKAFAMRIMHLGKEVYIVGDVNTPAITNDDLLVIASGSGETSTLKVFESKAKKIGTTVAHITTNSESSIAKEADFVLNIPASTNHLGHNGNSWQPAGNSFEQCLLITLDAVALMVAEKLNIDISSGLSLHANLE